MRTKLFFMLALLSVLAACNKSEKCPYTTTTAVASTTEVANLKAYLDSKSLPYTQHSSGIFYQILTPGSGATATVCSEVTVKYSGRTSTSATPFDQNSTGAAFTLGQLITGWQIGIPLIQKGGSIILYIPPSLGYGQQEMRDRNGNITIPSNSNLVFNIELVNVQ